MKKSLIGLLIAVLAVGVILVGCKPKAAALTDEFIILNGAEPESLDPHLISGVPEHRIFEGLFEGLLIYDAKTAEGIPGAAESWEVSDDGTVWTFKLRKATWSDGVKITADTVVKSWLRVLNPETAAPYAWFPAMFIKGAKEYNEGKAGPETVAIKAVDDYTFRMELVGPLPYVQGALPHYSFAIVPIHAIEKNGKEWTSPANFVGNGPFKLEEWKPQEKLTIVPNDKYWDKQAVKLGRVTYLPVDDNNTAFNIYMNGEADWMTTVPLDQMDAVKLRDDYQTAPRLGTYYYVFQNQKPPLNDPRIRKALSMSFNRVELVEKVVKGGQLPAASMVPPMTGYSAIKGNPTDVEKAKQLLADAGFAGGKKFPKLTVLYNTSEAHKKIGEYLQQQWKENLGIEVDLLNQEWATYLATRREGQFEIARAGWIGDYQDPNTFLDMFVEGSAMNGGRYTNPKYDELIGAAAKMKPGRDRFDTLAKAEEFFITEDQGVMPIYFYTNNDMVDTNKWGGWYTNVMGYHPVKDVYLKK